MVLLVCDCGALFCVVLAFMFVVFSLGCLLDIGWVLLFVLIICCLLLFAWVFARV